MIVVAHRRNRLAELDATPVALGVEVDVRSRGSELVVAHDPGEEGVPLDAWLARYRHRLLVANPKEEGLLGPLLARLHQHGVEDFFVLGPDPGEALPFWEAGEPRVAVRVSEIHAPETAYGLAGRAGWAWLDGYRGFPVDASTAQRLVGLGYRTCLVSPELYGRDVAEIPGFRAAAAATGVAFDAVCTRAWAAWLQAPRNTSSF